MVSSKFVGFMNGDLLLHSSLFDSLNYLSSLQVEGKLASHVMVMGRRYNHNIQSKHDFSNYNSLQFDSVIVQITQFSDLFISVAQDFFIFNRGTIDYNQLPDVVIGRNGYDNYMVHFCFAHSIPLVDISQSGIDIFDNLSV